MTDSSLLSLSPVDLGNRTIYRETRSSQKRPPFYICQRLRTHHHTCVVSFAQVISLKRGSMMCCEGQSQLSGGFCHRH